MNSWRLSSTRSPGKLSSLSRVPPVWPRPRPDIFATTAPQAATRGMSTMLVLSPTPPVECLSTLMPRIGLRSTTSPEWAMARVRSAVSRGVMPCRQIAMARALIW